MARTGLKPTELAYLAGFLDGEGCFSLAGSSIRVQAVNCYPGVLTLLRDAFGGRCRLREEGKNANCRRTFEWSIYAQGAENACRKLLPYLFEKKQQAELLLMIRATDKQSRAPLIQALKDMKHTEYENPYD